MAYADKKFRLKGGTIKIQKETGKKNFQEEKQIAIKSLTVF